MLPSEEIRAQRDFLMENTWVQRPPNKAGEGCGVVRVEPLDECFVKSTCLRAEAINHTTVAWMELFPEHRRDGRFESFTAANDAGGLTFDDVIGILNLAEKRALIAEEAENATSNI